jgi:ABC-2 type transport system permease protein
VSHLPSELARAAIRTAGFFSKEIVAVLRQPRLVASLVLGPFAILLLFGLGYRGPRPEFRTILVLPDDPALASTIDVYREGFAGVFKLQGTTHDRAAAVAALQAGEVDVVVIVPEDVYETLYAGEQPELRVLYTETDPTSSAWVRYFTEVQTGALNRRILIEVLGASRGPAAEWLDYVDLAQAELDQLEADLRSGDYAAAAARVGRLLVATELVPRGLLGVVDRLA